MKPQRLATLIENSVVEKLWIRLSLTLFVMPPLYLLLIKWLGAEVLAGWSIFFGIYLLAIFAAVIAQISDERKTFNIMRTLLKMLSPIVWGLIVAVFYLFILALIYRPL